MAALAVAIPATPALAAAPDRPRDDKGHALARLAATAPGSSPEASRASTSRRLQEARDRDGRVVLVVRTVKGRRLDVLASARSTASSAALRHRVDGAGFTSLAVAPADVDRVLSRLRGTPGVRSADRALLRTLDLVPNDRYYNEKQAAYLGQISAPAAWDRQQGSAAIRLAVVDSGMDVTHPELGGKVVGRFNAVVGGTDVTDRQGHGTFVGGVAAAATNNGQGVSGVGYNTSLLAIKAEDTSGFIPEDASVAGIRWAADHGARVVNLSFGGSDQSLAEQEAIAYAQQKGVLVVASAGNDGVSGRRYPAAYPGVVSVGATVGDRRTSWSQYGSWVTIAAPGENIYSTYPLAGAQMESQARIYATAAGTSFSSPMVAGAAALLFAQNPSATAAQVRDALVRSASPLPGQDLGAGRLDVAAALARIPPASVPAVTAPPSGGTVSQDVTLRASSGAGWVRFLVDGRSVGPLAPVTGGAATATWPTYGLPNGSHDVAAQDCTSTAECGTASAARTVVVDNLAPTINTPAADQAVTGRFTMDLGVPGGTVEVSDSARRLALVATPPYSLSLSGSDLTDDTADPGATTLKVRHCTAGGASCAGPTATVRVVNSSLRPTLSVAPTAFSPNGDGYVDRTSVTVRADGVAQSATVQILDGTGVRATLGTVALPANGTETFPWDGRVDGGGVVPASAYRVVLSTTAVGGTAEGYRVGVVRVDLSKPTFASASAPRSIYPYPDGFVDTATVTMTLSEPSQLSLLVRDSARRLVAWSTAPGTVSGRRSLTWNGRTGSGAVAPPGSYLLSFAARDVAGNLAYSADLPISASGRRLVSKTALLRQEGNEAFDAGGTASCANATEDYSDYPNGLWLGNGCSGAPEYAALLSAWTLPAATRYRYFVVKAFGNTTRPGSRLLVSAWNEQVGNDEFLGGASVPATGNRYVTLPAIPAAGHYSGRDVETGIWLTNDRRPSDFDVGFVLLYVSYQVLQ